MARRTVAGTARSAPRPVSRSSEEGRWATADSATGPQAATVYRLVSPDHVGPYGLKTIDLLKRHDLQIEDRHLETEEEATELRARLDVDTTPQTFIDGELIGTLDDLREYF